MQRTAAPADDSLLIGVVREDEWLLNVLVTTWALTTGRLPPRGRPEALSRDELIEFWADDRFL
ncbi:hypothetical protein [Nonomuraea dietziae]|uniref:hypothetical protein n=1 Tax=Nonomuraea dietziae TaxID=65515 RepID=UPI00342D0097